MEKITIEEILEPTGSVERAKAKLLAQNTLDKVYESIKEGDKKMARRRLDFLMGVLTTLVEVGIMDAIDTYPFIDEMGEELKEMN